MGSYKADDTDPNTPDSEHLFSTPFGFELLSPTDSLTINITNASGGPFVQSIWTKKMLPDVYNFFGIVLMKMTILFHWEVINLPLTPRLMMPRSLLRHWIMRWWINSMVMVVPALMLA